MRGQVGGLFVSYLAYHYNIRVLAQNGAQPRGKSIADLRLYLGLADAFNIVFYRVLKTDNVDPRLVQNIQNGVESSGFSRTGRAGNQNHSERFFYSFLDNLSIVARQPQLLKIQQADCRGPESPKHFFS